MRAAGPSVAALELTNVHSNPTAAPENTWMLRTVHPLQFIPMIVSPPA